MSADVLKDLAGATPSTAQAGPDDCIGCPDKITLDDSQCKGGCNVPCSFAARLAVIPAGPVPAFAPNCKIVIQASVRMLRDGTSQPPDPSPPKLTA